MNAIALLLASVATGAGVMSAGTVSSAETVIPDSAGMAQMEWAYDSWTVPWVQVKGTAPVLAPASHATLMVLACQTADLERDRLAQHLSREECEHRMEAIRAEQDSALSFRLELRVFSFPRSNELVRLDRLTTVTLEDDRGRLWTPVAIRRGPAVLAARGLKLERIYYHPPWLRGLQHFNPAQYDPGAGRDLTVAEHFVRFARRDKRSGDLVVSSRTRWLRVRLSSLGNEWVATWTFRQADGSRP